MVIFLVVAIASHSFVKSEFIRFRQKKFNSIKFYFSSVIHNFKLLSVMKKITQKIALLVAFFAFAGTAAAQTSAFCNTPSGHLGDPNFGATASHVFITISNVDANTISVLVAPRTETGGAPIDFLQVNAVGALSVIVGTDEGPVLPEYRALITFATPPQNVSLEILWSNPGWAGRWMVQNITVPFNANCTGGVISPPPAPTLSTVNYETVGHNWSWTLFENGNNAPELYSVVPNPAPGGINTSANVARYVVNANAAPWAGLWSNDLPDFTVSSENAIVRVMVYKDVISNFLVKFENENASVNFERAVANTVVNQWQELTFDFSAFIGSSVTRVVIIPDFPSSRTAGSINLWDNISFNSTVAPPVLNVPTTASRLPAIPSSSVISLHSRAYTNVGVDTWRTGWSNATFSDVQVAGTTVKRYSNLVFVGIETTGPNLINATGMTHFNFSIWTPDMSTFRVKLVDFGANGVWAGGDDVEHELTFNPALSTWVDFSVPLANFTGLSTRQHIAQLIFSGAPTGTAFVDNIFFFNDLTSATNAINSNEVSVFPNPSNNVLNIRSGKSLLKAEISNLLGQSVRQINLSGLETSISVSDLAAGNYILRLTTEDGVVSTRKFTKQ